MAARKSSRVNRKYKTKYRIRNWREYERGLRSRGVVREGLGKRPKSRWGRIVQQRRTTSPKTSRKARSWLDGGCVRGMQAKKRPGWRAPPRHAFSLVTRPRCMYHPLC